MSNLKETANFTFTVDTDKTRIVESRDEKTRNIVKRMVVEGIMSIADAVTGNNRRYGKKVWEKNLSEGSKFMKRLRERAVVGMLEHPKDEPDYDRVSHLFEDVKLLPNGEIWARVTIMETPRGQILKELFTLGVPVGASSRGNGTTTLTENGVEEVNDDYELETWDFVHTPALDEARARKVESLENNRKGTESMNKVEEAKKFLDDVKSQIHTMDSPHLIEAHLKAVEFLSALTESKESEAQQIRGGLATIISQISSRIAEANKTKGEKLKEELNKQYTSASEAISALVETLVRKNEELQKQIAELGNVSPDAQKELIETRRKLEAAFTVGEDLVKKIRRSIQERQHLENKYAAAVALLEQIIDVVRRRDLEGRVGEICEKVPALTKVKEDLLASRNKAELQDKLNKFCSLIESIGAVESGTRRIPQDAHREIVPQHFVRKGTRVTESASSSKPKSLFGKLAEREKASKRVNPEAVHKTVLELAKRGLVRS